MSGWWRTLVSSVGGRAFWTLVKRYPLDERTREFRERQWDAHETLRSRQGALLADLLSHAARRVPFYRERVGGVTPQTIADDPFGALRQFTLERKH